MGVWDCPLSSRGGREGRLSSARARHTLSTKRHGLLKCATRVRAQQPVVMRERGRPAEAVHALPRELRRQSA
eukprot:14701815-Alexandrium_andersonii.AAC.1